MHFQVRVQTQIWNNHELWNILQPSNPVVWNTFTRHFLWSILYVIYNSYLKLLIWGRKPLINFVLIWCLFFYSFFHEMQWNLACLPVHSWSPRSQGLHSFYPMVYSVTPEAEAWRPEGTTVRDYKKSDGFYFILFWTIFIQGCPVQRGWFEWGSDEKKKIQKTVTLTYKKWKN